jgi:hypothetical protein
MALTVRGDGTGGIYLVGSAWWNDYYDLLTGAMHDQPVELNYRPGSGTAGNTLTLKGDGFNFLLKGLKTDNATTAFSIDSNGAMVLAGGLAIAGTLTGVTSLTMAGALSGVTTIGASGAASVGSVVSSGDVAGTTGTFSGDITSHSKPVYYVDGNGTTAGTRIFIGTSSPGSPAEGDIWIKA